MVVLQIISIYIALTNVAAQYSDCQQGYRCVPLERCSTNTDFFSSCRSINGSGVCCGDQQNEQRIIFPSPGENFRGPTLGRQPGSHRSPHVPPESCGQSSTCRRHDGKCVPMILCQSTASNLIHTNNKIQTCSLQDGSQGVVCPPFSAGDRKQQVFPSADRGTSTQSSTTSFSSIPAAFPISSSVSPDNILSIRPSQNAIQTANSEIQGILEEFRTPLQSSGSSSSPAFSPDILQLLNHQVFNASQVNQFGGLENLQLLSQIVSQNRIGERVSGATERGFPRQSYIPPRQTQSQLSFESITDIGNTQADFVLPNCSPLPIPKCPNSIYRTIDGTCNNPLNPNLGAALTGFKRLLRNTYDDGIFQFRTKSVLGGTLPSARTISDRIIDNNSKESRRMTLSVMQWGQFIDHDFTHQILFSTTAQRPIQCCQDNGRVFPPKPLHPQCIPIKIDARDSFYSRFGQRCMNMVRTVPVSSPDCRPRVGVQQNELTAYLDASNVYGSQPEESANIRTFRDGLLRTSRGNLLPVREIVSGSTSSCRGKVCFMAGETRVNEQSGLAVMHTIFHREHNRVARQLKITKGPLDDETLFQMSRRIVIAEWQHIIYNEWIPLIIGPRYAYDHGLLPYTHGHSFDYNPQIDPSISTEFATAAFRFGHSLVRSDYDFIDSSGRTIRTENLTSTFFNPESLLYYLNEHSRTLVARPGETFDEKVTKSIQARLFMTNGKFGLDLVSLNIQRGRDHGIPRYIDTLKACTGHRVNHWADLRNFMSSDNIDGLRSVYAHPADVDLFSGGLLERPAYEAEVGPTFQCLITQQFMELRYGDRFFYDNGGMAHSFSDAQLTEIRKSSWARIMCDNLRTKDHQDFDRVQPLAFLREHHIYNPITHCDSLAIPRVDLRAF